MDDCYQIYLQIYQNNHQKLPDFHMIFFSSLLPHPPSTPPFPLYNPHIGILMAGFQKVASLLRFHCHSGDGLGPYLAGEDSPHCVIVTQGFVQPTYVHTQHTHTHTHMLNHIAFFKYPSSLLKLHTYLESSTQVAVVSGRGWTEVRGLFGLGRSLLPTLQSSCFSSNMTPVHSATIHEHAPDCINHQVFTKGAQSTLLPRAISSSPIGSCMLIREALDTEPGFKWSCRSL